MIIIFCGVPGAGKSAVGKKLVSKLKKIGNVQIFVSDKFKPPVYKKLLKLLSENRGKYDFLIFDATFFKRSHRENIKKLAKGEKTIIVFFYISLPTALARNKKRKANIPERGLRTMFAKMEKPAHPDIYIDTEKNSPQKAADKIFAYVIRNFKTRGRS